MLHEALAVSVVAILDVVALLCRVDAHPTAAMFCAVHDMLPIHRALSVFKECCLLL